MKLIWNPAMTLDGYIAKLDGDSDWVAEQDSQFFRSLVRQAGCVIAGRNTYDQYKGDVFPIDGAFTYVLTSRPHDAEPADGVEFITATPKELIHKLAAAGFEAAVLAGGSQTNSAFVAAGLVDEIVVNIYPMLFGQGLQLVQGAQCALELKLTATTVLDGGIVQCRY